MVFWGIILGLLLQQTRAEKKNKQGEKDEGETMRNQNKSVRQHYKKQRS